MEPTQIKGRPNSVLAGYSIVFASYVFFVASIYAIVLSKFMPMTGNKILDFLREDYHYSLLLPLMLPVTFFFVFWNWMGLKVFKHN